IPLEITRVGGPGGKYARAAGACGFRHHGGAARSRVFAPNSGADGAVARRKAIHALAPGAVSIHASAVWRTARVVARHAGTKDSAGAANDAVGTNHLAGGGEVTISIQCHERS